MSAYLDIVVFIADASLGEPGVAITIEA